MPYKDKENERAAKLRYLRKNKEYYQQKSREQKEKLRAYISEYKTKNPCKRCGESDPVCLQFHHRDPSEKDISVANVVRRGWGLKRVQNEIDKCDMLCANCHFKVHAYELDAE